LISLFRGLRSILVLAAAGLFGAFLILGGLLMLVETFRMTVLNADMSVVSVLRPTDKILLGIVLLVVGCGIAPGFAAERACRCSRVTARAARPDWEGFFANGQWLAR